MKINFFNEEVSFKIRKPAAIRKWIESVATAEGYGIKELNYVFCSDAYLHGINLQFLQHDTYTDIITFDRSEEEGMLEADVFISIERVKENSASYSKSFLEELHRVMIHGVLHLCGYTDKGEQQQLAMRKKEDACLSLLST